MRSEAVLALVRNYGEPQTGLLIIVDMVTEYLDSFIPTNIKLSTSVTDSRQCKSHYPTLGVTESTSSPQRGTTDP
jgi:hypothetical protein